MMFIMLMLSVIFMPIFAGIGAGIVLATNSDKPRWAEVTVFIALISFILALGALLFFADNPEFW